MLIFSGFSLLLHQLNPESFAQCRKTRKKTTGICAYFKVFRRSASAKGKQKIQELVLVGGAIIPQKLGYYCIGNQKALWRKRNAFTVKIKTAFRDFFRFL